MTDKIQTIPSMNLKEAFISRLKEIHVNDDDMKDVEVNVVYNAYCWKTMQREVKMAYNRENDEEGDEDEDEEDEDEEDEEDDEEEDEEDDEEEDEKYMSEWEKCSMENLFLVLVSLRSDSPQINDLCSLELIRDSLICKKRCDSDVNPRFNSLKEEINAYADKNESDSSQTDYFCLLNKCNLFIEEVIRSIFT